MAYKRLFLILVLRDHYRVMHSRLPKSDEFVKPFISRGELGALVFKIGRFFFVKNNL